MIYREIVHTCSNPEVAGAAVDSIGGDFARDLQLPRLPRRKVSPWRLRGELVREFAAAADEIDLQRVIAAARQGGSADSERSALHPRARR